MGLLVSILDTALIQGFIPHRAKESELLEVEEWARSTVVGVFMVSVSKVERPSPPSLATVSFRAQGSENLES